MHLEIFLLISILGSLISRFGSYDPSKNITQIVQNQQSGVILLPSTEARFDTNVIGFEAFAAIAGTVTFRVRKL